MIPKVPVKFKKTEPNAKVPVYAHADDSGMDLYVLERTVLLPHETKTLKTGIAFEIPDGYEIQIRLRSGATKSYPITMPNAPATIDNGYRGPVGIIVTNLHSSLIVIPEGVRIAQAVLCPVVQADLQEVETLEDTDRGDKGFGHSGVF